MHHLSLSRVFLETYDNFKFLVLRKKRFCGYVALLALFNAVFTQMLYDLAENRADDPLFYVVLAVTIALLISLVFTGMNVQAYYYLQHRKDGQVEPFSHFKDLCKATLRFTLQYFVGNSLIVLPLFLLFMPFMFVDFEIGPVTQYIFTSLISLCALGYYLIFLLLGPVLLFSKGSLLSKVKLTLRLFNSNKLKLFLIALMFLAGAIAVDFLFALLAISFAKFGMDKLVMMFYFNVLILVILPSLIHPLYHQLLSIEHLKNKMEINLTE